MSAKHPLCFYDDNGPVFQQAIMSEFRKIDGVAYEKPILINAEWTRRAQPLNWGIFEMGKDYVVLILHGKKLPSCNPEWNRQLGECLDSYTQVMGIIQGYPALSVDHWIHLWLITTAVEEGISWIPTQSARETALCIRSWAKRLQIHDQPPSLGRVTPKWKTLDQAQSEFLAGLMLTGSKKAKVLVSHFSSPVEIFQHIQLKSPLDIKGFGPEFVDQNARLLLKKTAPSEGP